MRERFPGHYRPTEQEVEELWASALVVADTNVLLTLYRLPERSRAKLLEILGRLAERLLLPHQVAVEFQRNRIDVIEQQVKAYEKLSARLEGFAAEVGKDLRRHPRLEKADIEERIEAALGPVRAHLEELRENHPAPLGDGDPLGPDTVRDALDEVFSGRLGPERDLDELTETGRARYEDRRPPGYEDSEKPEPDRYGDLSIWLDALAEAERRGVGVILVTEERKEDWWWKKGGEIVGPRPELVEEMASRTGQRFYLYSLDRFMEEAAGALGLQFTSEEREEVVAARSPELFDPAGAEWRIDHELRERAQREVHPNQWVAQGRVGFFASPASGRTYYGPPLPDGFPPSPGPGTGWRGEVREVGRSAELEIRWEPRPRQRGEGPFGRLICMVTNPRGETASATDTGGELSAYLRFPDDFRPLLRPTPGHYGFDWFFEPPGSRRAEPVAGGAFVLGDPGAAA